MFITLLMASPGESVNKCEMNDLLAVFEPLYLSAAGLEMWFIRHVFCGFWTEFVCNAWVRVAHSR